MTTSKIATWTLALVAAGTLAGCGGCGGGIHVDTPDATADAAPADANVDATAIDTGRDGTPADIAAADIAVRDTAAGRDQLTAVDAQLGDRGSGADAGLPAVDPHWVSPTGAAAWAACQSATPLAGTAACSIDTANSDGVAGDLVYLRGGSYGSGIAPAHDGTSTDRIVYSGYAGEAAMISGAAAGIDAYGRAYLTVNAVDVEGVTCFADLRTAHHVAILNSTLINSSDQGGWPMGIKMYTDSQYNRLAHCLVGQVGYESSDPANDYGGVINIGSWENPADTTSYNLIEDNHFFHGGHHIMELSAHHNVIRYNTFHNENWTACVRASTGDLCGNRDFIIEDDSPDAERNLFEGNRFSFAGGSIEESAGSSGASVRTPRNIFRRNLFYLNDGVGLGFYIDSGSAYDARENRVYHNVFYGNGVMPATGGDRRYGYGLTFDNSGGISAPQPITGVAVVNNLFYDNSNGDLFFYYTDPAQQSVRGNYYAAASGSNQSGVITVDLAADNTQSSADPIFVDVSPAVSVDNVDRFDFRLQAQSPAIDHGVFLTMAVGAGSGTLLVVADAGFFCDGYGIVDGDLIQLEGQTTVARVISADYGANQLTLDRGLTWTAGLGVSLAYRGTAPDIGAYETSP